jgi:hypothetical protein
VRATAHRAATAHNLLNNNDNARPAEWNQSCPELDRRAEMIMWAIQIFLALAFGAAGTMKLVRSKAQLAANPHMGLGS